MFLVVCGSRRYYAEMLNPCQKGAMRAEIEHPGFLLHLTFIQRFRQSYFVLLPVLHSKWVPFRRKGADGVRPQGAGGCTQPAPCRPLRSWGRGQTPASLQKGQGRVIALLGRHLRGQHFME